MSDRDWNSELAKIDQHLEKMSDDQLLPASEAKTPAAKAKVVEKQRTTSTIGVFFRLVLAVALGVGIYFWPYDARCGVGLAGYLGAVLVVMLGGAWSAVWTFRHGAGKAHVLSLLIVLWAMLLASIEVLPRVGYARPTIAHPAAWSCAP